MIKKIILNPIQPTKITNIDKITNRIDSKLILKSVNLLFQRLIKFYADEIKSSGFSERDRSG